MGIIKRQQNDVLYFFNLGIFILNFFGCAACTHANGDKTLIALAFGLSVFMAVMVSDF